ncbi:unnamed protein product, partial [Staurois parvus]
MSLCPVRSLCKLLSGLSLSLFLSLFFVDHCLKVFLNPRPCIHYIWSARTLHSLYLVCPDSAFTISGLPGLCIHYIWSPRTLHSLYLVSPDPAFTI